MRQICAVALFGLVVACVVVTPGVATQPTPVTVPSAATAPPLGDDAVGTLGRTPETDDTVTRIQLSPNGSAVWTVRYRTRLRTDTDIAAYREFQSTLRNDTASYESSFRDRITPVVADAATETNREMAVGEVTATTTIQQVPRRWGVVSYRFRWSNFTGGDDRLRAGDVFAGGYYLAANDTLVISAPSGYRVTRVAPTPDARSDGRLRWRGQRSFADGRPLVVATPPTPTSSPTPTSTRTPTTAPLSTTSPPVDGDDSLVAVVLVVGVVLVGLAALVIAGRGPFAGRGWPVTGDGLPGDSPASPSSDTGDAASADDTGTTVDATTDAPDPTVARETDAGGVSNGDAAVADTPETDEPAGVALDGDESASTDSDGDEPTDTGDEDLPADAATAAGVASTDDSGHDDLPEPYASVLDGLRPPLTDAERVERLLARERGRMRQSALADELEWSASKTSRVLSAMADDGRVEKLRVGRENVVDLVADEE